MNSARISTASMPMALIHDLTGIRARLARSFMGKDPGIEGAQH